LEPTSNSISDFGEIDAEIQGYPRLTRKSKHIAILIKEKHPKELCISLVKKLYLETVTQQQMARSKPRQRNRIQPKDKPSK